MKSSLIHVKHDKNVLLISKIESPKVYFQGQWEKLKSVGDWKITWKKLEILGIELLSYLTDTDPVVAFNSKFKAGAETDGIICSVSKSEGYLVVLEAKCKNKVESNNVTQLRGRMSDYNARIGFIFSIGSITKKRGALDQIKDFNSRNEGIIVPLIDENMQDLFKSQITIKDFLERQILIAKVDPFDLFQ